MTILLLLEERTAKKRTKPNETICRSLLKEMGAGNCLS